jgi:imidazolonepropionase
MSLERKVGSITRGKLANLILTKEINSYHFIPYSFGNPCIEKVFLKGTEIK